MARHGGRLKLRSKPVQLYVRLCIRPLGLQAYHVGLGNYKVLCTTAAAFVCLQLTPYRIPECSISSKSFALCWRQPKIPSPECSTTMGERIYCHPQADSFVVSQLFSVARHVGRLKLGSKLNNDTWKNNHLRTLDKMKCSYAGKRSKLKKQIVGNGSGTRYWHEMNELSLIRLLNYWSIMLIDKQM